MWMHSTVAHVTSNTNQNATYTSLLQAEEQLKSGQNGVEQAHALIEVSKDVLALSLDKQASLIFCRLFAVSLLTACPSLAAQ